MCNVKISTKFIMDQHRIPFISAAGGLLGHSMLKRDRAYGLVSNDTHRLPMPGYYKETESHQGSPSHLPAQGTQYAFRHQASSSREIKFPWGVNPIPTLDGVPKLGGRSQTNSASSSIASVPSPRKSEDRRMSLRNSIMYQVDTSKSIDNDRSAPIHQVEIEPGEYVVTNGFETIIDLVKSVYNALLGKARGGALSPGDTGDMEMGLDGSHPVHPSPKTASAPYSAFEERHSSPVIFPSSIDQLLANASPAKPARVERPLPTGDPPTFPTLPSPIPRNYDH